MEIYFGGWGNINKWAFIGWIGNDWRYPLKFGNGWKSSILRGFPPARNSSSATRTSAPWCSGGSPLSCGPSRCRCGLALDPYGDHCAACATTGVLRARAAPIERAVARICREAGARVAVNVPLSAHEPLCPGHRRPPDRSPRKRFAALAWGSVGTRRDPRQPPGPHRTGFATSDATPGAAILAASQRKREYTPSFPARAAAT